MRTTSQAATVFKKKEVGFGYCSKYLSIHHATIELADITFTAVSLALQVANVS